MDALPPNISNKMAKKAAKNARAATAREILESTRASSGSVEVRAAFVTIYCAPRASFSIKLRLRPLLLRSRDLHVQQAKRTPAARKNRGQSAQGASKRRLSSSARCVIKLSSAPFEQRPKPSARRPKLIAFTVVASTSRRSSSTPMCASVNSTRRLDNQQRRL